MIKCFQLVTGHDIIGDATEDGPVWIIKEPAAVHLVPNQNQTSTFGIAMIPFMPYAEGSKITVKKEAIAIELDPTVEMRNNYNKMFGSGIQIANVMPK